MNFCPDCGENLNQSWNHCPHCGRNIGAPTGGHGDSGTSSVSDLGGRKRNRAAQAFAAVVLLVFVLILLPLPHPNDQTVHSWTLVPSTTSICSPDSIYLSGTWTSDAGVPIGIEFINSSGAKLYLANGTSGSFSFGTGGDACSVSVWALFPTTVSVNAVSWAPVIPVGLP